MRKNVGQVYIFCVFVVLFVIGVLLLIFGIFKVDWFVEFLCLVDFIVLCLSEWFNLVIVLSVEVLVDVGFGVVDVVDVSVCLQCFVLLIVWLFLEIVVSGGIIEFDLVEVVIFYDVLCQYYVVELFGWFWLKCDSYLLIFGLIKVCGGIYEVFVYVECLVLEYGLVGFDDDYLWLVEVDCWVFFVCYWIVVGFIGNLGFFIGIIGVVLGFQVSVYMFVDVCQWKKDKLCVYGVMVVEYVFDYSVVVEQGCCEVVGDFYIYFVDDENFCDLFFGYVVVVE